MTPATFRLPKENRTRGGVPFGSSFLGSMKYWSFLVSTWTSTGLPVSP